MLLMPLSERHDIMRADAHIMRAMYYGVSMMPARQRAFTGASDAITRALPGVDAITPRDVMPHWRATLP